MNAPQRSRGQYFLSGPVAQTRPEAVLQQKLSALERQAGLALLANVFFAPLVGEIAPASNRETIISACRAFACSEICDSVSGGGLQARRSPTQRDGAVRLSWEYTWDAAGRLVFLKGTPITEGEELSTAGVTKDYQFSYNREGKCILARIAAYNIEDGQRQEPLEWAINLRMIEEQRTQPRELSIASFHGRKREPGESAFDLSGIEPEDMTRIMKRDPETPVLPGDRIAELESAISFLDLCLQDNQLFYNTPGEILYLELSRQLSSATAELQEMTQERALERLQAAFALNGTFSCLVGDIFCDRQLDAAGKREHLRRYEENLLRAAIPDPDAPREAEKARVSLADEIALQLRAVRAALDLLEEEKD